MAVTIKAEIVESSKREAPTRVYGAEVRVGMVRSRRSPGKERELLKIAEKLSEHYMASLSRVFRVIEHEALRVQFYAAIVAKLHAWEESSEERTIFSAVVSAVPTKLHYRVWAE